MFARDLKLEPCNETQRFSFRISLFACVFINTNLLPWRFMESVPIWYIVQVRQHSRGIGGRVWGEWMGNYIQHDSAKDALAYRVARGLASFLTHLNVFRRAEGSRRGHRKNVSLGQIRAVITRWCTLSSNNKNHNAAHTLISYVQARVPRFYS